MHINNLPVDILIVILKHVCHTGNCILNKLKPNLPLLATCRSWRTISMPYLFDRVQLNYSNSVVLRKRFAEGESIDEPKDETITTNAGIITSAGQINVVKHVGITIYYFADPLPGLFAVLNYLADLSKRWPSVKSLDIQLNYNIAAYNASSSDMSRFDNAVPSVVKNFKLLLPGVVNMKYCEYRNNTVASLLHSQLLAAYSEQTTRLEINQPLSLINSYVLNKLRHLTIDVRIKEACQLPVILADTLLSLSLQEMPYSYNWSMFAVKSEPEVIEFLNLTALEVHYAMDTGDRAPINSGMHNRPQWPMLHFPKLKFIKLLNSHAATPFLEHSVLPKELQSFNVGGSIEVISRLGRHLISDFKFLSMSITYKESDSHINPFIAINQKFNYAQPLNSSIQDLALSFNNSNVTIAAATTLVKYLLPRLPALLELRASQIPALDIDDFVIEFKYYYPHLDTIKYNSIFSTSFICLITA